MAIGQLDIHMPKNMALDTDLTLITKINSGWIIDSFILFKKKKKKNGSSTQMENTELYNSWNIT